MSHNAHHRRHHNHQPVNNPFANRGGGSPRNNVGYADHRYGNGNGKHHGGRRGRQVTPLCCALTVLIGLVVYSSLPSNQPAYNSSSGSGIMDVQQQDTIYKKKETENTDFGGSNSNLRGSKTTGGGFENTPNDEDTHPQVNSNPFGADEDTHSQANGNPFAADEDTHPQEQGGVFEDPADEFEDPALQQPPDSNSFDSNNNDPNNPNKSPSEDVTPKSGGNSVASPEDPNVSPDSDHKSDQSPDEENKMPDIPGSDDPGDSNNSQKDSVDSNADPDDTNADSNADPDDTNADSNADPDTHTGKAYPSESNGSQGSQDDSKTDTLDADKFQFVDNKSITDNFGDANVTGSEDVSSSNVTKSDDSDDESYVVVPAGMKWNATATNVTTSNATASFNDTLAATDLTTSSASNETLISSNTTSVAASNATIDAVNATFDHAINTTSTINISTVEQASSKSSEATPAFNVSAVDFNSSSTFTELSPNVTSGNFTSTFSNGTTSNSTFSLGLHHDVTSGNFSYPSANHTALETPLNITGTLNETDGATSISNSTNTTGSSSTKSSRMNAPIMVIPEGDEEAKLLESTKNSTSIDFPSNSTNTTEVAALNVTDVVPFGNSTNATHILAPVNATNATDAFVPMGNVTNATLLNSSLPGVTEEERD